MDISFKIHQDRIISADINKVETIRCIICHEIPLFALECKNCQNIFCQNCKVEWKKLKNNCPLQCKGEFLVQPIHKTLKDLIISLKITCKNKVLGCQKVDTLVNILIHEKKLCDYSEIFCPNMDGKLFLTKKNLEEHLLVCEFQTITCYFCQKTFKKHKKETHNCIETLKNNIQKLKIIEENSALELENLSLELLDLQKENKENNIDKIIEKSINIHYKEIKNTIRKQINNEVYNEKSKLLKINFDKIIIPISSDLYNLSCCSRTETNMIWIPKKQIKKCQTCKNKLNEVRYTCKVCHRFYCVKCKKVIIKDGKCPIDHKLEKTNVKNLNKLEGLSTVCYFCFNGNLTSGFMDRNCNLFICEKCF